MTSLIVTAENGEPPSIAILAREFRVALCHAQT
jgi:hypothetical protein